MNSFKSQNQMSSAEAGRYHSASDVSQLIETFTTETAVTLSNPHIVQNNTATACVIAVKLSGDTVYRAMAFPAHGKETIAASYIGGTGDGTTCTSVIVRGIK